MNDVRGFPVPSMITRALLAVSISFLLAPALFAATTVEINDSSDTIHNNPVGENCSNTGTGTCSLRDAVLFANTTGTSGQPYTFKFDQLAAADHTITLLNTPGHGSLDPIAVRVTIDGTTHPDGKVELSGVNLTGGSPPGLVLDGTGASTVKGMVINHFGGDGIDVGPGAVASQINGNFIGTDFTGEIAAGNGSDGLAVNATAVTVNGNVISANGQFGLHIFGSFLPTANAVNVQNNKIGTDATGLLALGNTSDGIRVDTGANGNIIGGANVVSANGGHGIFISGNGSFPGLNVISGNFIGTRLGGLGALANTGDGIRIDSSNDNIIGGGPFGGDIISGNQGNGIHINNSDNALVVNNVIGLDALTGIAGGEGNALDGVLITICTNTVVGGPGGVATRNIISGNGGAGVHISGQAGNTDSITVEGNFIGTNILGNDSNVRPNGTGVFVEGSSATNITIGGSGSSNSNTVAWNTGLGVRIGLSAGDFVAGVKVLSNSIHDNGLLGIDLGNDGVTANDPGDVDDASPNAFQNFPVLTLALVSNATGKILVKGSQDSAQATNQVQFFLADTDSSNHGEGKTLILDQTGVPNGAFSFGPSSPSSAVAAGNLATSTATTTDGTSEFSANLAFVANVIPIANAGSNQNLGTGATVTLHGEASSDPDSLPNGPTILNGNFTWLQTSGPGVLLTNGTSANPTFVASTPGTYVFSLVVSDGMDVSTNPASVSIFVISPSSTALLSSVNPSVFGQTVTFTATVTGTGPTPTGTVTFMDGAATLGTGSLNGSGQATLSTSALAVGSHPITAVYGGDANFTGSTSLIVNQVVNLASTTTSVVSSVNPSVFGQSVSFTATVAAVPPGSGIPTGTVSFFDGATPLGTQSLNGAGQAVLTTSALTVGSHPITGVYSGSASFTGSVSPILSQVVNQAATTTTVISSVNPSLVGQSVTFTATVAAVAPGAGTPTGTVNFFDGATLLGPGTLNGSAQASFATSALIQGSHSITAVYGGDTSFTGSTSSILTQVVNATGGTPSSTALVSSLNPSVFGQAVTLTATVTGSGPTPTGMVTFMDGVTAIGTGTLSGSAVATFTTSVLAVGSHPITAVYAGDSTYATSTSPIVDQVVNPAATTTTVISSVNPSMVGQSVTFTATVTAVAPGAGTPTGTVNFFDGATLLGPGTLNGSAQATFATSALTQGSHSITAVYGGDTSFTGSTSSILTQVVNATGGTPSSTALVSSLNPSVFGQAVTFTATVTGSGPTPTGTATFMDGVTTLGTTALNGSGVATFTTSALAVGSHPVTAVYAGDSTYAASTSPIVAQVVNQAATTTTVISSVNPSLVGQSVTFTATVAAVAPGAGTPTGTVNFFDGATLLGPGTLNGSAQASFATSALIQGSHSITAVYGGDTSFTGSTSSILTQVVNATGGTPSSTALVSNLNPSVFGQAVTFTATVTGSGPTPTGTATFMDGATTLGTTALNGSGVATFTTAVLALGSHPITAVYAGDATYAASTSPVVNQVVNPSGGAPSVTTIVSSVNPSLVGQSVTFTATVTGSGSTPTGTVTFLDGATTLGAVALNGSGQASLSTASLTQGSHSITAAYGGDATYAPSTANLNQLVNPVVVGAAAEIPALDGRALLGLAGLLAAVGIWLTRRKS
ncbi:MAG: beta strand repeat-containing protein [Thermoanaerobaculia bacterium]